MASGFSIKLDGFDQLQETLKNAPEELVDYVAADLHDGALAIQGEAKLRAPVKYDILRGSIVVDEPTNNGLSISVSALADYSAYVEFGTGTHVDVPEDVEEYALQFKGDKEIPGMNARPFFFPAIFEKTPEIIKEYYKLPCKKYFRNQMIDVKAPLRTAYYSLLAGRLVFGGNTVPVSDSVEKLSDKVDLYVLFTQQNGREENTQQSWNSLETILIDIVSRGTRVSKSTVDSIASQIFTLLFPLPGKNALPYQTGLHFGSVRVTDDRYLVFTQVGGKNVTRRLITTTQLVTQQAAG